MKLTTLKPQCIMQEGTWSDFREEVKKVEPILFSLIEKISPGKKYKIFKISYPFGEKITDLGMIRIPDKAGNVNRLDHPDIPDRFRQLLGYCPTPMILQLHNGGEVFVEAGERIIPLNVFSPGDLYGLFEVMVPLTGCPFTPCWSVTAGARSVFLGAKVTDAISHRRLHTKYGVPNEPPMTLSEQWYYFKNIVNKTEQGAQWRCEILVFTGDWFIPQETDANWIGFHYYIAKKSWIQSRSTRIRDELSMIWQVFNSALGMRRIKPNPYIIETVMHNILLANGVIPGFRPVNNDNELLLPPVPLEDAYEYDYKLKEYAPILMIPTILNSRCDTLFYSLTYPTLLGSTPIIGKKDRFINELKEITRLMQMLYKAIQHDVYLFQFVKNSKFEYFHRQSDRDGEIRNSIEILGDKSVKQYMQRFPKKTFPFQGPFFHGFIKISRKP